MTTARHFRQIIDGHRHRIYNLCFYYLGGSQDAEDATQEVLIRLWKNWDRVEEEALTVWLARVARNACIDLIRKRRRYRNVVAEDGFETACAGVVDERGDPRSVLEEEDLRERVLSAIGELDEPYRGIVILREIQGMAYTEICEALDIPMSRVKVYLHRGRRVLRDRLREKVADHEF